MNTNDGDDVGVVFRKSLGHYTVHTNGREIDCSLSSLIHKQLIYPTADPTSLRQRVQEVREIEHVDPVAIGDRVRYVDAGQGSGMIGDIPTGEDREICEEFQRSRPVAYISETRPVRQLWMHSLCSPSGLEIPLFRT